ncbi:MAG: tetratricopeptide repeat protein [Bacteroidetes bacterium]|nr:tetratricopeptide repeat protein [Bacteroidota bacterium]
MILFCVTITTNAQTENELLNKINTTKSDSVKCRTLNSLSLILCKTKTDEALLYANQAISIAEQKNNFTLKQESYLSAAICYDIKDDFIVCKNNFYKAIAAAKQLANKTFLAGIYHEFGYTNLNKNKLDSSLHYLLLAIDIRKELKDSSNLVESYNKAAQVYRRMNNYENAIEFYKRCINILGALKDDYGLSVVYRNIGTAYRNEKKIDSAFLSFTKAYPLAINFDDTYNVYLIKLNTALCFNDKQEYQKALEIFKSLNDSIYNEGSDFPLFILGKGEAYLGIKNYSDAINYLQQAASLTYKPSKIEYAGIINKLLSKYYEETDNYKLAFAHFKKYKALYDSQYVESNTKNVDALAAKYKTKEKEQEIALLNKESQLKDLQIKEKKRTILLNTLGLILVTIVAGGILYLYRSKQKINKQLEEKNNIISVSLKEKEVLLKEIHHRVKNNLQVISSLLNLQSKNISDEKALQALNEGKNRVRSMALIHQNLYRDDNLMGVDVQQYIEKLIESLFTSYNIQINKIALQTNIDKIELDVDTVIPLGLILNELISNALKYAFENTEKGILQIDLQLVNKKFNLFCKNCKLQ